MALFGSPNVEKLTEKRDYAGLAKALTDKSPETREGAAEALTEIGDSASVQPIVEQVAEAKDEDVIATGADVLRSMGDAAVPTLRAGMKAAPPGDRPAYAALLGRMGAEHGLDPLLEVSHDEDPAMRGMTAMGLGLIVAPRSTARLTEIFKSDDDIDTRGFAMLALATHQHPGAFETFTAELDESEPVSRALGAMGLETLGDERGRENLERLASSDDDERVRERAQAALAELGG